MALEQEISKGIMEAMKAKDTVRLTTLRNVKKYIIEAKTASAGITELSDAEVLKIIAKLAKQGAESAAVYAQQNRPDLAAEESAQVARAADVPAQTDDRRGIDRGRPVDHRRGRCNLDERDGEGDGCRIEKIGRYG